jgi:hypothetical protein
MSNKDTIIEALTIQLKIEREGNLALAKLAKREWVGLTQEERDEIDEACLSQMQALFAIEEKLKEKNT